MGKRNSTTAAVDTAASIRPSAGAAGVPIDDQTGRSNTSESTTRKLLQSHTTVHLTITFLLATDTLDKELLKRVNHFVRSHNFIQQSLQGHTTSQRRAFERDVYDYARGVGLPKDDARNEVRKARTFCGELDYDSDCSVLGDEADDSAAIITEVATRALSGLQKTYKRATTSKRSVKPTSKSNIIGNGNILTVQNPSSGSSREKDVTDAIAVDAPTETSQPPEESKKRKSNQTDCQRAQCDSTNAGVDKSSKKVKKSIRKHDVGENSKEASLPGVKNPVVHSKASKKSKTEASQDKTKSLAVGEQLLNTSEPKIDIVVEHAKSEKQKKKKGARKTTEQSNTGARATETTSKHSSLPSQHDGSSEHLREASITKKPVQHMKGLTDGTVVSTGFSGSNEKDKDLEKPKKSLKQESSASHERESVVSNEKKESKKKTKEKKDNPKSTVEQSQVHHVEDPILNHESETRMKTPRGATSQSHHSGQGVSVAGNGDNIQATNTSRHLHAVKKGNDLTGQTVTIATPKAALSDSDHEKFSAYFPLSNQKSKKQHLVQEVELSPETLTTSKVKSQMQINKEKAAQFRAELAAESRHSIGPSPGPAPTSVTQGENSTHSDEVSQQDSQKPSEPMVSVASTSSGSNEVLVKSPHVPRTIENAQELSVYHQPASEGRKMPNNRKSRKKYKSFPGTDGSNVDMTGTKGVPLHSVSTPEGERSVSIELEIPESRSGHNGWFPVNLDASVTDTPAASTYQTATEDLLVPLRTGKRDQNISKKRKSRTNVAQGTESIELEPAKKKPRKVSKEPVGFTSPMIQ